LYDQCPRSSLFPYTTLFRSLLLEIEVDHRFDSETTTAFARGVVGGASEDRLLTFGIGRPQHLELGIVEKLPLYLGHHVVGLSLRSEEHTSELQSRENLVCRL